MKIKDAEMIILLQKRLENAALITPEKAAVIAQWLISSKTVTAQTMFDSQDATPTAEENENV